MLKLNVCGAAGKMMLEMWEVVATSKIFDDDYDKGTHQSSPSK